MSGNLEKLALASRLAVSHPGELIDRVLTLWENLRQHEGIQHSGIEWQEFVQGLSTAVGPSFMKVFDDPAIADVEHEVRARMDAMDRTPFTSLHSADVRLARTCYALCRTMKPECVLETGVAYGVTTSFLLAALDANGLGVLHSVDLPPLARSADDYVGKLIPERLRGRWRLHRGATRRVLPKLLPTLGPIDIFLHDSLHAYASLARELRLVAPRLAARAAVIVDDVDANRAFPEWAALATPKYSVLVRRSVQQGLFGVAVF